VPVWLAEVEAVAAAAEDADLGPAGDCRDPELALGARAAERHELAATRHPVRPLPGARLLDGRHAPATSAPHVGAHRSLVVRRHSFGSPTGSPRRPNRRSWPHHRGRDPVGQDRLRGRRLVVDATCKT